MIRFLAILAGAPALAIPALAAAAGAADSAAVYSNVCAHPETGELRGRRIVILRFPDANYALVQFAEGGMLPPEAMQVRLDADELITFAIVDGPMKGTRFRGMVTDEMLTGAFSTYADPRLAPEEVALPRQRTAPEPMPTCE